LNATRRLSTVWTAAGYLLAAAIVCVVLSALAARITAAQLQDQAQWQLARVQANEPLWEWRFRKPHDLIAGRAFGSAKVHALHSTLARFRPIPPHYASICVV
jgi:hypothetical protein